MKRVKTVLKIIKSVEEGGQGLFHKHLNLISSKCSDVTVDVLNTHKEDAKGNLSLSLHIPKTPAPPRVPAFTSGQAALDFGALTVDRGHPGESCALIVSKGRVRERACWHHKAF